MVYNLQAFAMEDKMASLQITAEDTCNNLQFDFIASLNSDMLVGNWHDWYVGNWLLEAFMFIFTFALSQIILVKTVKLYPKYSLDIRITVTLIWNEH